MPWGSWSDLPTDLALWLIGLAVAVSYIRPRRCQENGRVERSHGVLGRWAEPATCPDAAALQARLTEASRRQRERYPAVAGQSRLAAYPALRAGGQPYDPAQEGKVFDEQRVWDHLGTGRWRRRVDRVGRISVYNRALGVGRRWAGQEVTLRFDPKAVAWVVRDDAGTEIKRHPAPELSRERILALEVTHRRGTTHEPTPQVQPDTR